MAYAKESSFELEKAVIPMSTRMKQIKALLEEVEELKRRIVLADSNQNMPYVIKTKILREMRESLFLSEHLALKLMQIEIEDCPEHDGHDGDGHGGDGHRQ